MSTPTPAVSGPPVTRRLVLAGAAGAGAAITVGNTTPAHARSTRPSRGLTAYVGSRTTASRNARGAGITVWRVPRQGDWRLLQTVPADDGDPSTPAPAGVIPINPSFLTLSADQRHLYAVHGDDTRVSAFTIDPETGHLTLQNTIDIARRNPVHLTLDPTGRWLLIACLAVPGSVVVVDVDPDGALGQVVSTLELPGTPGPHKNAQLGPNPHHVVFDPSGRWVAIADRGVDRVFIARLDTATGALTLNEPGWVQTRELEGPRHIAFHPTRPFAYLITELRSCVTAYRWDDEAGTLTPVQVLPAQPAEMTGDTRGAEIEIAPSGRYLYVSNRSGAGDASPGGPAPDTIGIFAIGRDGHLEPLNWVSTQGIRPRFFGIDPPGRRLFAANEVSDTISGRTLQRGGGVLRPLGIVARTGSPVCIVFREPR